MCEDKKITSPCKKINKITRSHGLTVSKVSKAYISSIASSFFYNKNNISSTKNA